jgi:hypothetical protein
MRIYMRLTSYQTGLLLAVLFKRAEASRARLSETTVRKLSGRSNLRTVFISELRDALDDLGFAFFEIERGFAMVPLAALNGAPPITAKRFMPDIAASIEKGKPIDFEKLERELGLDQDDGAEAEEA